jgi:hypothetical protein
VTLFFPEHDLEELDSLLREIETQEDSGRAYQAAAAEAWVRQVGDSRSGGNNGRRFQNQRSPRQFHQRSRGGFKSGNSFKNSTKSDKECKMYNATDSPYFKSHEIAECWLQDDRDTSISQDAMGTMFG